MRKTTYCFTSGNRLRAGTACAILIALFVLGLNAASSCAGIYTVSYSGGACVTENDGVSSTIPYTPTSFGYGALGLASWDYKTLSDGSRAATSGSARCEGSIIATFTWSPSFPGDEPPKAVVVAESCTASWEGSGIIPGSGSSANGLGFPEVPIAPSPPGDPFIRVGGASAGTRYHIKQDPGYVFANDASCTPTASVSGTGDATPPWRGGSGPASVYYAASASPVDINLEGGILHEDQGKQFLIGQKIVATMSTGGLQATSYQWSVSGGEPFKNWLGRQNNTTYIPLGAETNSSLTFRFKKPAKTCMITCSVHLQTPAGSLPAGGLDATAIKKCAARRPDSASFSAYTPQNPGRFGVAGRSVDGVDLYGWPEVTYLAFHGLDSPGYTHDMTGICWDGSIQTSTASPNPWGGDGGWHYVQKWQGNRYQVKGGVRQSLTINGQSLLDTNYPYEPLPYDPDEGWPGTYAADGVDNYAADGPGMPLNNYSGTGTVTEVEANEHFDTWMMYRPPGEGSAFVPIKKIKWSWLGKAQIVRGGWSLLLHDSGWQFDGDYPAFPEWTGFINSVNGSAWVP